MADALGIPIEAVKLTWKDSIKKVVEGSADETTFWKNYSNLHQVPLPDQWIKKWLTFYVKQTPLHEEVLELVQEVKDAGNLTPLLSDTIPSHDQANRERKVYHLFNPLFPSFETHLVKPDGKAFCHVLEVLKLQPSECVFIDDLLINIEGAKKVGNHAIHFTTTKKLREDLTSQGVLLKKDQKLKRSSQIKKNSPLFQNMAESLSVLKNGKSFSFLNLDLPEEDQRIFSEPTVRDSADFNQMAFLDKLSPKLEDFCQTHLEDKDFDACSRVARTVSSISQSVLQATKQETAWVTVRFFRPSQKYEIYRWHRDASYFEPFDSAQIKFAAVLKGRSTLFYSIKESEKDRFDFIERDATISVDQKRLKLHEWIGHSHVE